jgi:hypothetical protein
MNQDHRNQSARQIAQHEIAPFFAGVYYYLSVLPNLHNHLHILTPFLEVKGANYFQSGKVFSLFYDI